MAILIQHNMTNITFILSSVKKTIEEWNLLSDSTVILCAVGHNYRSLNLFHTRKFFRVLIYFNILREHLDCCFSLLSVGPLKVSKANFITSANLSSVSICCGYEYHLPVSQRKESAFLRGSEWGYWLDKRQTEKKLTDYRQNDKKLPITDRKNINRQPTWSVIVGMLFIQFSH